MCSHHHSCNTAGEACLALPKLNLQFLTFHDYLLRNFNLFRLEATYEVPSERKTFHMSSQLDTLRARACLQYMGSRICSQSAGLPMLRTVSSSCTST
jgi:Intron-binding protein aquarius N-terminus